MSESLNGNSRLTERSVSRSLLLQEAKSEEVQEIMERAPGWILNYGILVIAGFIFLFLLGSIIIKYPDIIGTRVTITTLDPPINIVARTSGKIKFSTEEGQLVKKGEILGYIENASVPNDVFRLIDEIKDVKDFVNLPAVVPPQEISLSGDLQVGELQENYILLISSIGNLQLSARLNLHQQQINAFQKRIAQHRILNNHLQIQGVTQKEELILVEKKLRMDEKLFSENVIAEVDLNISKITHLQAKRAVQLSENNMINNDIAIAQLESQIVQTAIEQKQEYNHHRQSVANALKQLESQLSAWQQQFVLTAPSEGRVSVFKFYSDDQFVSAGSEILAIVPNTKNIYGQVQMSVGGSGKVEIGQDVIIKLDNFPFREYGTVKGKVAAISSMPQDNLYTIRISLPNGLVTTYKYELPFRQHLSGSAEIITRNLSVFQRFFFSIRSLLDQTNY